MGGFGLLCFQIATILGLINAYPGIRMWAKCNRTSGHWCCKNNDDHKRSCSFYKKEPFEKKCVFFTPTHHLVEQLDLEKTCMNFSSAIKFALRGFKISQIWLLKDLAKFDLEDLLRASAEDLGKRTFGTAYKALLEMGFLVAVKRLKDVTMADKEFREKLKV
ncbi:hypothetical protein L6452_24353 [Arctium lappa]|uniref:Uncharacterized protein n=1 Tax=Arctium lappa TaxID=4217 RepID=A0ACB9A9L7_ARCLA|nr:hypothetical protein L6452_24353 [Arctium lappa]